MNDTLKSVAVAASIVLLGIFVISAIYGGMATNVHTVEGESITADVGNTTQVAEDYGESYYDNESITNSSGTLLVEGDDYDWFTSNGSVQWYDTGNVSDGEEMSIDYAFDAKPERPRESIGVMSSAFRLAGVIIIVLTASLVLAAVAGFDKLGRGGRL